MPPTAEHARLQQAHDLKAPWKKWGPYLSERQWGTLREDYSLDGAAWDSFPHDHARSAPTGGEKMASRASPTKSSAYVSRWRFGTGRTRSSRNASSV